jgi:hypothetical protein
LLFQPCPVHGGPRKQGAKLYELRATVTWRDCKRLKSGGRVRPAKNLGAIHNWFTEGFDTANLKEVRALLDELSDSP